MQYFLILLVAFCALPVALPACCRHRFSKFKQRCEIHVNEEKIISSPTVNGKYANKFNCIWKITAPARQTVKLFFTKFKVQLHKTCRADSVRLSDGPNIRSRKIANLCGWHPRHAYHPVGTYTSTGRHMTLRFRTNTNTQNQGWIAEVTFDDTTVPCSSTPVVLSSDIRLNHPGSGTYEDDKECRWLIQAPEGKYVQFNLKFLDIEYGGDCLFDYIELHDGDNPNAVAISSRFCGTLIDWMQSQLVQTSTGNAMFVVFKSDESINAEGFDGQFSAVATPGVPVCPKDPVAISGNGSLLFPANGLRYVNLMSCEWQFSADEGDRIKVTFEMMDIEIDQACEFDVLNIYDSKSPTASPKYTLCGTEHPVIISSSNYLLMRFSSDSSVTGGGFLIDYETGDYKTVAGNDSGGIDLPVYGCADEPQIISPSGGIIQVPLTAGTYNNNMSCMWTLYAPENHVVRLKFVHLDMVPSENCQGDRVDIADGETLNGNTIGRECSSNITTAEYISTKNIMKVHFFSNEEEVASGFKLVLRPGLKGKCGSPQVTRQTGRIVGGTVAKPHSSPWQVSIRFNRRYQHQCGGSIISSQWIVTAAHCVFPGDENRFVVLAGAHKKQWSGSGETKRQIMSIAKIIQYPGYASGQAVPDVALIKLTSHLDLDPITTEGTAHPVCLPLDDTLVPDYTSCYITGWGYTQHVDQQNFLNEAVVPIVSQEVCRSKEYYGSVIKYYEVCAGYREGGKDSCQGDSGGPLVCLINGKYELHGITSWGFGCGEALKPGVYTRVTQCVDWIMNTTSSG